MGTKRMIGGDKDKGAKKAIAKKAAGKGKRKASGKDKPETVAETTPETTAAAGKPETVAEVKTPPPPSVDVAAWDAILSQRRTVREWEVKEAMAKSQHKAAKDNLEEANRSLGQLIDDANSGQAALPFPAGGTVTASGGTDAATPDPEAWRSEPVSVLHLPGKLAQALAEHRPSLRTIGDISDFLATPWAKLTDIAGVGEGKAATIEDALAKFWADRPQARKPAPAPTPAPAPHDPAAFMAKLAADIDALAGGLDKPATGKRADRPKWHAIKLAKVAGLREQAVEIFARGKVKTLGQVAAIGRPVTEIEGITEADQDAILAAISAEIDPPAPAPTEPATPAPDAAATNAGPATDPAPDEASTTNPPTCADCENLATTADPLNGDRLCRDCASERAEDRRPEN